MGRFLILMSAVFIGGISMSQASSNPYSRSEIHPEIFKFVKIYERRVRALEIETQDKIRRGNDRDLDALVDLRRMVSASLKLTWTVANPFTTYPRLGEELKEARRLTDFAKKSLKKLDVASINARITRSQEALVKLETAFQKRAHPLSQRALASQ